MNRTYAPVITVLLALAAGVPAALFAQDRYPSKPVRVISPVPPGSGTDNVLRSAGQEMQSRLGQPWVVENRAGANMIIGAEGCARSAHDGYTLCFISNDVTSLNPHLFSKLPYDAEQDFKAVARMFFLVEGMVASASLPVNSVAELQALAAAKSGALNVGTMGAWSSTDIFRLWLNDRWKVNVVGIPYKGGPPIIQALVADEIHFSRIGLGSVGGQLAAGKVKVLAVAGTKRSRLLPGVPTMAEAGLGGYPVRAWWGIAVPSGAPEPIIGRLSSELVRLFREPKFSEFVESQFLEPAPQTSEEFGAFLKTDRELTGELLRKYNVPRQ
jgi:tripartite-type tricarboxylate transporter receptor subunit TctC